MLAIVCKNNDWEGPLNCTLEVVPNTLEVVPNTLEVVGIMNNDVEL